MTIMKNKLFVLAFCWLFSLNAICQVEHTCEVSQMGNIMIPKEKILANIPDESTTMKYVKVNHRFLCIGFQIVTWNSVKIAKTICLR